MLLHCGLLARRLPESQGTSPGIKCLYVSLWLLAGGRRSRNRPTVCFPGPQPARGRGMQSSEHTPELEISERPPFPKRVIFVYEVKTPSPLLKYSRTISFSELVVCSIRHVYNFCQLGYCLESSLLTAQDLALNPSPGVWWGQSWLPLMEIRLAAPPGPGPEQTSAQQNVPWRAGHQSREFRSRWLPEVR